MSMYECPRFNICSCNLCPLDPDIELRDKLLGEPDCPMEKNVRYKLGEGLPMNGLTKREWAAREKWLKMDEKAKQETLQRIKKHRFQKKTPAKVDFA